MRKLHISIAIILSICLLFAGCGSSNDDKTISVSGDLAYYAAMDAETLKEKCKGNYIEITGEANAVYSALGQVRIGDSFDDKIQFSCDLSNSDDAENIQKGDLVTVRGKCSTCSSTIIYLKNCVIEKHTNQTEVETTIPIDISTTIPTTEPFITPATEPATEPSTDITTEPPHKHTFNAATCTTPKTCSCGITEGEANGHAYSNGKCTTCGKVDPNYNHEIMVWIPTKGGKKYHTYAGCSNMDDPEQVTQSEAESLGFTPCKRCH